MGGKSQPSPPEPPDPYATGRAQTSSNVNTAIANTWLGNADEYSPLGTIDYSRTGTQWVTENVRNKDGQLTGQVERYEIPTFTRNVTLSPEEQMKLKGSQDIQLNLLGLGQQQIGNVSRALGLGAFDPKSYLAANPDLLPLATKWDEAKYLAANPDVAAAPKKFVASRYLEMNPDVAAVIKAQTGDGSSQAFDAEKYLAAYPDVAAAIQQMGGDREQLAKGHYEQFGKAEGRSPTGAPSANADELAWQHWQQFGRNEGRAGGGEQNGVDAYEHWLQFGEREGRQGGGSKEPIDLYQHWLEKGRNEGRPGSGFSEQAPDLLEGLPESVNSIGGTEGFAESRKKVEDALLARLNPQIERDRAALDVQLTNEGFNRGTEAYDKAMDEYLRQVNDARMGVVRAGGEEENRLFNMRMAGAQFQNTSRERALQERLVKRQTPLNEIMAILSGSQVNMPQFSPYQSGNIANTPIGDYVYRSADIEQRNYAAQLNASAQQNAAMFSAGASLLGGLFKMSDRRVKRDVKYLAKLRDGVNLYQFRYNWDDEIHVGVMADEVERVMPWAVTTRGGVALVDYGAL